MARGYGFRNKDTSAIYVVTKPDGEVIAGPYFMQGTAKTQMTKYVEGLAENAFFREKREQGITCTYYDFYRLSKEERVRIINAEKHNAQIRIYTYSGLNAAYEYKEK